MKRFLLVMAFAVLVMLASRTDPLPRVPTTASP